MIPLRNFSRLFRKTLQQPEYAFAVFLKRVQASLSYYFGNGKSSLPEAITLFLTHRCNLRCKMCGQWGESGVTKDLPVNEVRRELTIDDFRKLFESISSHRPNITLFGGEPLIYASASDLIKLIKEKKLHCLMITNGSLLSQHAEQLVKLGLDELNVSLDGGRELHDEIRGQSGLFEKITAGLTRVQKLKQEGRLHKPLVNLQCTITKYNYAQLEQMLDVAKEVRADSLTFHNLIFLGRDLVEKQRDFDRQLGSSSKEWEGFIFSPGIDPDELFKKIHEIKHRRLPFAVDFYPNFSKQGLREYYQNPSFLPAEYRARCLSPWTVAYVFPDGEVRPCLNSSYSFGNIMTTDFPAIWNGPQAVKFRQTLKQNQIFPVCVRCTELYRY
jgi:MoaA/NifB/PqqE/SkfB family radical SAM enzyme